MRSRVVLVCAVGEASGARAAAAALACAGSEPDRPGLFVDVGGRLPRPALFSSPGARELEERLAAHRPKLAAASRGQICQLSIDEADLESDLCAVLPLARDSLAVVHLPPNAARRALDAPPFAPTGALLRADLPDDRALTALVAAGLIGRGLAVRVLARPLPWVAARRALFGTLGPDASGGLPPRLRRRLLA